MIKAVTAMYDMLDVKVDVIYNRTANVSESEIETNGFAVLGKAALGTMVLGGEE